MRRCLAASFALLEMRQVLQTVLGEVDLRPVERRSERVARSSIAFVPDRQALAVVVGRAPGRSGTPDRSDTPDRSGTPGCLERTASERMASDRPSAPGFVNERCRPAGLPAG